MVDSPSVSESHVTSLGTSDNTSLGDQRVGQGGLSVVDVGNDRHVTNLRGDRKKNKDPGKSFRLSMLCHCPSTYVGRPRHERVHLINGKVNLKDKTT